MVRSIAHARELLEYVLKETERLNAMIVKQTRHCAELKAWEEAEERAGRHNAASGSDFSSAPGLDASPETTQQFFSRSVSRSASGNAGRVETHLRT
jgi:hypothetical protein